MLTGCQKLDSILTTSYMHGFIKKTKLNMSCSGLIDQNIYTEKSYKRPPHIFSSSSESKIRSIKIHDHMNKPMSTSGSVSFCIPKCVILLTQTKHVYRYPISKSHTLLTSN